jgi:hypothetical protein
VLTDKFAFRRVLLETNQQSSELDSLIAIADVFPENVITVLLENVLNFYQNIEIYYFG